MGLSMEGECPNLKGTVKVEREGLGPALAWLQLSIFWGGAASFPKRDSPVSILIDVDGFKLHVPGV